MIDVPPNPLSLPNPLHPAIVHFPIVLTVVATLLSVLSVVSKRFGFTQYTALALIMAVLAAHLAILTGQNQPEVFHAIRPELRPLLHEHAEWGERLRWVLLFAAAVSIVTLVVIRWSSLRRAFAFLVMVASFGACYCAWEAAQHGGLLVFNHGVAVHSDDWRATPTPTN